MSALAVGTVITVALGMWLYFNLVDSMSVRHMPAAVRAELATLRASSHPDQARLWQIAQQYYDIRRFQPGLENPDWLMLFILVVTAVPVIIGLGLWASRPLSSQFTAVAQAARRVSDGEFAARVQVVPHAPDELAELAMDFNDMTTRLQQFEQEVRDSSAMLAHELRTPLNAAMGRLQGMLDEVFPLEREQVRSVHRQLEQLNRLVSDLHLFSLARAGQLALEPDAFALRELIAERLEWVGPQLAQAGIEPVWPSTTRVRLYADRDRVGQVLSILIHNVLRYASSGGSLEITVSEQAGEVSITVGDRGPGVAPEQLSQMRERFWRADHSRARHSGGSGLGLAIALAISQSHGGDLVCRNRRGGGMAVEMRLPASAAAAPR
ncbi:signal transduction histidine kinase [Duganella sp. SG902]|uniref:sensor histidine kinase n=1 Tax=Duganella sp. SG902 TaxID=2587016 RepID=UPI00183D060E|nr:ATP-binding protein [Duganella sp. SG902]NVM77526.1 signal transduction histidine kinase [Duganella sp. SG902]